MEESDKHISRALLRIKIKHLALEPALIRHEIARARKRAHYRALAAAGNGQNTDPYRDPWLAVVVTNHRNKVIRPEARAAQLAYAFIRGKAYNDVEPTSKNPPLIKLRLVDLVMSYGNWPGGVKKSDVEQKIIAWIEASGRFAYDKSAGWFVPVKAQAA